MNPGLLLALAAAFLLAVVPAAAGGGGSKRPPHPSLAPVEDKPGLPRVLLIGDSISMGYTIPVRRLLEGVANVHRVPANAAHTRFGLTHLDEWLGDKPWDVIHFNWGLHDLKIMEDGEHQVPLEEYRENLRRIVERLEKTGARLIWCSTTPVPEGKVSPPRRNADVVAYNAAAAEVMRKHHIPIDDLYSFALPRLAEIQLSVNVHFTPQGYQALARQVAAAIRKQLGLTATRAEGAEAD